MYKRQLADNPLLTCRIPGGKNPVRIICDSRLRTPLTSQLVTTAGQIPTIIATCSTAKEKHVPYEKAGCRILAAKEREGHVDLPDLMRKLGQEKIDSILLEGGGTLKMCIRDRVCTSGIKFNPAEQNLIYRSITYILQKKNRLIWI